MSPAQPRPGRALWLLLLCGNGAGGAVEPSFPVPPDLRPPGCSSEVVDSDGKQFADLRVSIIIPYRSERWEHIKGSVDSILHYTPKKLVSEILFVSDGNKLEATYANELRQLSPLISLLVLPHPGVGLIAAKMRAVAASSLESSVLVFLEPHVRVNRQWLEPLLRRIRLYPRALVMPVLDPIPQKDFSQYHRGSYGHWRFEWNLNLIFTNPALVREATSKPYPSPATSGGIYAIRRDWWQTLGLFDAGMIGWGGDHVEASFKVWRCGGHIEIVPCSHVGHVFRSPSGRPYEVEVRQVVGNYARLAAVWLDDYQEDFYKMKPDAKRIGFGDVTKARELRERLKCKNMSWYLANVDHEMLWEKDHICVPGCDRKTLGNICCRRPAASQRSTIDRIIPASEYVPIRSPDPVDEDAFYKDANEGRTEL